MTDGSAGSVDVPPTPVTASAGDVAHPDPPTPDPPTPEAAAAVSGPADAVATDSGSGDSAATARSESAGAGAARSSDTVEPADHQGDDDPAPGPALTPPLTEATAEPSIGPSVPPPVVGDFRMALVSNITVDLPNQHPSVVLRESESPRRQLTFSIAFHDAVILSHALRRIPTPRPLTHELLSGILQRFDIDVVAVRLVGRQGSIYFAELDLMGRNGRSVHSCRPTDALTVALQQPVPVPILIDRRLFEQAGDVVPPA